MAIKFDRWRPSKTTTRQEKALLKRCVRVKKLFRFLREHRDALFADAFQKELEEMYRRSGAGKSPVPPALMAMATLVAVLDTSVCEETCTTCAGHLRSRISRRPSARWPPEVLLV